MNVSNPPIRALLHAPTGSSLQRARNNALNILREQPEAQVHIVVNADGVRAALDTPHPQTDQLLLVCANTLRKMELTAPETVQTVPSAAMALISMQQEGWIYIRA
jgi:intracellular sulfur oxidation DsrE/DsrF family protein